MPEPPKGSATWDSYPNEQAGFSEQVYFFELLADGDGKTQVLLKNAHGTQGVALRYSKKQLPYFTLWKNTPLAADGYVTGLEPGTNFPNPRSFEGEQNRVVKLKPGETVKFEVELDVLGDAQGRCRRRKGDREDAGRHQTASVFHAASRLDASADARIRVHSTQFRPAASGG